MQNELIRQFVGLIMASEAETSVSRNAILTAVGLDPIEIERTIDSIRDDAVAGYDSDNPSWDDIMRKADLL